MRRVEKNVLACEVRRLSPNSPALGKPVPRKRVRVGELHVLLRLIWMDEKTLVLVVEHLYTLAPDREAGARGLRWNRRSH